MNDIFARQGPRSTFLVAANDSGKISEVCRLLRKIK